MTKYINRNNTNIRAEFNQLNEMFFHNSLQDIELIWSKSRKQLGLCTAKKINGKVWVQSIKVSDFYELTLHKFREILIHEMIHAYTAKLCNEMSHGRNFKYMADKINCVTDYNISRCNSEPLKVTEKNNDGVTLIYVMKGEVIAGFMTYSIKKFLDCDKFYSNFKINGYTFKVKMSLNPNLQRFTRQRKMSKKSVKYNVVSKENIAYLD